MASRVIRIMTGYSDGTLELSDHAHTKAKRTDTIIWQIHSHSGVKSITAIEEKKTSYDIFSTDPYPQGSHWRGEISSIAPIGAEYRYSIFWKATNNTEHKYDPIISINPSFSDDIVETATFFLSLALLCLLFWRKKKVKNNLTNIMGKN